jgi:hypothetical protein
MRASGGAAVVALAATLGGSACLPPPGGTLQCPVAGQEPAGPIPFDDLAAVGDALEARFPTCFGGIVRTGPNAVDIYVVGLHLPVLTLAEGLIGPTYSVTLRASDHAIADVRDLKAEIDADADELHAAGIFTQATGIRIAGVGPRVLVGIDPDTAAARAGLESRYGADWLTIFHYEFTEG